jgi:cytochrome c oxidase cbb3-type subunit 3
MKHLGSCFRCGVVSLLIVLADVSITVAQGEKAPGISPAVGNAENGRVLFDTSCGSCHGRAGQQIARTDLTESKLLESDQFEVALADSLRQGSPDKGMPQFTFSSQQVADLAAHIKNLRGRKRPVDLSDLLTGDVEAGKTYFTGAGRCSTCHSVTGDLAGVASRYVGTQLMHQIMYPKNPKKKVTVTLPTGSTVTGTLEHADRFIVALRDADGFYRSWFTDRVQYSVDAPVDAHVELLRKHTDRDIHNLYAYLQMLVAPKGEGEHKAPAQLGGNSR